MIKTLEWKSHKRQQEEYIILKTQEYGGGCIA